MDAEKARAQLDSYERAARAALAQRYGPAKAPIAHLNDRQLVALFAIRTRESLVAPLRARARAPDCGAA